MPPPLPTTILLRILHASTSPSPSPTIDTLTHLWLSLRPVCRAFRSETESIFLTSYLPNLEIRVAVYSQDIYQTCDPTVRLGEVKYDARRPSVPDTAGEFEEEGGLERMVERGERAGRGGGVDERGMRSGVREGKVEVPDDIVFKFSHTTTPTSGDGGDGNVNGTAVFVPAVRYERDMHTAMALASLASRFSSRLMVKKPTHVVSWYGCVNDVFLPGLKVDLVGGWVEVEWRGLVGGFLGEERGVCGVRRGLVGGRKGVRRGLCALGGGRGMVGKAGPAVRSRVSGSVHESPTMDMPMAKKRRGNGKAKAKGRDGVRRRVGRDKVDIDLMNQSPSASSAAPVVIDLDAVQTPISPPSPNFDFDFDFDGNLDVDLNLDILSEADWDHIPPPPHRFDANEFGFNFSSSSPPPLPFALSSSPLSSLATSPVTPSSHTHPQPPSPFPILHSHYPTFYPLLTHPPPPIPTNTLNWDIDPARLEARRRRVAHLFRKFCCNGDKNVGVGNASVGENDVGREMGEEIGWEMEREMGYRGWIMGEWCAVERVQSLRMQVGG